jgi:hypothetical protein
VWSGLVWLGILGIDGWVVGIGKVLLERSTYIHTY